MSSEVTVLIPAHGSSPFIKYTLDSVAKNSVRPDEVLIIDDGLSSQAIADINSFSSRLSIVVIANAGKGLVDALNTGLRAARGKYIARIDNDDLMAENRIERQLAQFESNPNLVAVGSQCNYINSDGARIGRSNYPVGLLNNLPNFKVKCLIAHPSTMFTLHAATNIGGYRSVFTWDGVDIAEDFDFWLRLSKVGKISVADELLTEYRQHNAQLSSRYILGQIIGTPYISAINLGNTSHPTKVSFRNGKSDQVNVFLHLISENLGFKHYFICRLALYQFRRNKIASQTVSIRFISKLFSLLQN
jgi:glycosyltransferase involved in cell wall biosynthesis